MLRALINDEFVPHTILVKNFLPTLNMLSRKQMVMFRTQEKRRLRTFFKVIRILNSTWMSNDNGINLIIGSQRIRAPTSPAELESITNPVKRVPQ